MYRQLTLLLCVLSLAAFVKISLAQSLAQSRYPELNVRPHPGTMLCIITDILHGINRTRNYYCKHNDIPKILECEYFRDSMSRGWKRRFPKLCFDPRESRKPETFESFIASVYQTILAYDITFENLQQREREAKCPDSLCQGTPCKVEPCNKLDMSVPDLHYCFLRNISDCMHELSDQVKSLATTLEHEISTPENIVDSIYLLEKFAAPAHRQLHTIALLEDLMRDIIHIQLILEEMI